VTHMCPPLKGYRYDSKYQKVEPGSFSVVNSHYLVEFGLRTLTSLLKRFRESMDDHLRSMVIPFIPILVESVKSRHTQTAVWALKAILRAEPYGIFSVDAGVPPAIAEGVLDLLEYSNEKDLNQLSLEVIAKLLTKCDKFSISQNQLRGLISYLNHDINELLEEGINFDLLKCLVVKGYHLPELYDIMTEGIRQMLTVNNPSVHSRISTIFVQFLLHFPMEEGRFKEHLSFVVKNLEHSYESSRMAMLDTLIKMFKSFPNGMMHTHFDLFFVPLVLQFTNETSSNCRKHIAEAIRILVKAVSFKFTENALKLTMGWMSTVDELKKSTQMKNIKNKKKNVIEQKTKQVSEEEKDKKIDLTRTSIQVFGFIVESIGEKSLPFAQDILKNKLFGHIEEETNRFLKLGDELPEDDEKWQTSYHSLVTLEKIRQKVSELNGSDDMERYLDPVVKLINHPHMWLRQISTRILGHFMGNFPEDWSEKENCISEPADFHTLARSTIRLMGSPFLSDSLAEQVTRLLIFIAKAYNNIEKYAEITKIADTEEETENPEKMSSIQWLFNALRRIIQFKPDVNKLNTIRCLAAICIQIPADDIVPYLEHVLSPLIAQMQNPEAKEDVKFLCQGVVDVIKEHVGHDRFFDKFYKEKTRILGEKAKRKEEKSRHKLLDPAAVAEENQEKKQRAKRRKLEKKQAVMEIAPEDSIVVTSAKRKAMNT